MSWCAGGHRNCHPLCTNSIRNCHWHPSAQQCLMLTWAIAGWFSSVHKVPSVLYWFVPDGKSILWLEEKELKLVKLNTYALFPDNREMDEFFFPLQEIFACSDFCMVQNSSNFSKSVPEKCCLSLPIPWMHDRLFDHVCRLQQKALSLAFLYLPLGWSTEPNIAPAADAGRWISQLVACGHKGLLSNHKKNSPCEGVFQAFSTQSIQSAWV